MGTKAKKKRPMRYRKSGLKSVAQINKNLAILSKLK
jgi:hypothetical protein